MVSEDRGGELSGSIEQFALSDVVQFLSGSEKSGKLSLARDGEIVGVIYFDVGTVIHAEVSGPATKGEEAFFDLMRTADGTFDFTPDVATDEKTVRLNSTNLLIEGARRKDEWHLISKHIPDMERIPEFVLPDDSQTGKQITLNTSEWVVLSKIDGERNLKEVARAASISEYHTCRLLYPLIENQLIRLRAPKR